MAWQLLLHVGPQAVPALVQAPRGTRQLGAGTAPAPAAAGGQPPTRGRPGTGPGWGPHWALSAPKLTGPQKAGSLGAGGS